MLRQKGLRNLEKKHVFEKGGGWVLRRNLISKLTSLSIENTLNTGNMVD